MKLTNHTWLYRLSANSKKCAFEKTKIAYLGLIVLGERVVANQSKIQAMVSWSTPTNLKELQGFLGLTWILVQICNRLHLNRITSNYTIEERSVRMEQRGEVGFKELNIAMSTIPILALLDFS